MIVQFKRLTILDNEIIIQLILGSWSSLTRSQFSFTSHPGFDGNGTGLTFVIGMGGGGKEGP